MTTIPCDECNGTGFISFKSWSGAKDNDESPITCPRIRCIAGQIELTDAEVKAMEAEQANIRG